MAGRRGRVAGGGGRLLPQRGQLQLHGICGRQLRQRAALRGLNALAPHGRRRAAQSPILEFAKGLLVEAIDALGEQVADRRLRRKAGVVLGGHRLRVVARRLRLGRVQGRLLRLRRRWQALRLQIPQHGGTLGRRELHVAAVQPRVPDLALRRRRQLHANGSAIGGVWRACANASHATPQLACHMAAGGPGAAEPPLLDDPDAIAAENDDGAVLSTHMLAMARCSIPKDRSAWKKTIL